ncbi:MAG: hypothetical protein HUK15_09365, partial [Bacteroidales bacterium]|nr:hypothetical protein [Bacteroidales bacterium]
MSDRKSIKNWAKDDRPREKLIEKGPLALSNAELLAIIIGSGNKKKSALDVAKEILEDCDNNIDTLCHKTYHQFLKFDSIGLAKAVTIAAAIELCRRRQPKEIKIIGCSQDLYDAVLPMVIDSNYEMVLVVYMAKNHGILKISIIGEGGVDA